MNPLVWITGLLLVGLFVMVLEVFIPSGGLLGFISIAAIVAAVATAVAAVREIINAIGDTHTAKMRARSHRPRLQSRDGRG